MAAGCGGGGDEGGGGGTTGGGGGGGNVTALPASSVHPWSTRATGDPDYLIASDLPLQGGSRTQTMQIVEAIRYVLDQQDWKAGDHKIALPGLRRLDGPGSAKWDPDKCSANAHAYAANEQADRRDRHVQLGLRRDRDPGAEPGAGRRPPAALAREHVRLPDRSRARGDEPDKYYPSGKRNYARVAPSDPNQGAVDGRVHEGAGRQAASTILNDKEAYGLGVAKNFRGAAKAPRDEGHGLRGLRPEAVELPGALHARSRRRIRTRIFIGGLIDENGGPADQRQGRGARPERRRRVQAVADAAGRLHDRRDLRSARAERRTPRARSSASPVSAIDKYTGAAQTFIDDFKPTTRRQAGRPVRDPRRAGGPGPAGRDREVGRHARPSVIDNVFKTKVTDGLIGELRDQRERRPDRREGCGRPLHDLQGHEQAADAPDDGARRRSSSRRRGRRRPARKRGYETDVTKEGGTPSPVSFRIPRIAVAARTEEPSPRARVRGASDRAALSIIGLGFVVLLVRLARGQPRQRPERLLHGLPDRPDERARSTRWSRSATRSSTASCS